MTGVKKPARDEVDAKIKRQAELCDERRKSLNDDIRECKEGIDEILKVLRGEGSTDSGLVGLVQQHEKRLNAHSVSSKMLWGLFITLFIALVLAIVISGKGSAKGVGVDPNLESGAPLVYVFNYRVQLLVTREPLPFLENSVPPEPELL